MHELQHLRLFTNQFNETVPAELANLTRLESIHIRDNRLSGRIPTEMGLLSNTLIAMDFSQNAFTGSIPSELGQLTLLNQLSLYFNDLEGVVPTELAELVNVGTSATSVGTHVRALYLRPMEYVVLGVPDEADGSQRLVLGPHPCESWSPFHPCPSSSHERNEHAFIFCLPCSHHLLCLPIESAISIAGDSVGDGYYDDGNVG